MPYIVKTTVVKTTVVENDDDSFSFETTYDAWEYLLDLLDTLTESWTDEDALVSYGAAVKTAVNSDQALPGLVAMTAPNGAIVVVGVIESNG